MRTELKVRLPIQPSLRPLKPLSSARVAVVHEWLYTYAGAEKVLEQILHCLPNADLFSMIDFLPEDQRGFLGGRKVQTSFLQRMPAVKRKHQYYLPLMPLAMERFDLSAYDVVVTSSYAVAKGVITGPNQLHLCYCHSPVRYAWDLQHQYLAQWRMNKGWRAILATYILHKLRIWDHVGSNGVDRFLSNSQFIARRIWKTYRRRATVVYPPVDTEKFTPGEERSDEYVTVSRLVGYKRVDILVDAFRKMPDRKLTVMGTGEDLENLRASAPANVTCLGHTPHKVMLDKLRKARGFLFAAEEDFGISPVEAQACGVPVIAYGRGGVLESVRGLWVGEQGARDPTGVFFNRQDSESVVEAIRFFESREAQFLPKNCVENAKRFAPANFCRHFLDSADAAWQAFQMRERDPNLPEWEG
jgi:glycosyltransferase involved in cell wall biosynthesis